MISVIDRAVLDQVFSNPKTCRMFLGEMQRRGCEFEKPVSSLTAEEMKRVAWALYLELDARENVQ